MFCHIFIGKKLKPPVSLKTAKQPKKVPKKKIRDSDTEISKKMKKLGRLKQNLEDHQFLLQANLVPQNNPAERHLEC